MSVVKVGVVVLSFVVGDLFLSAVVQLFLGIEGIVGIVVAITFLIPGVVLFMMTEDTDFDWETYCEKGDYRVDTAAVFAGGGVGTGIGYELSTVATLGSNVQLATICGIVAAYEVFVYRNRTLFPVHVWPWFGSIYFRIRLDK